MSQPDHQTAAALAIPLQDLGRGASAKVTVVEDRDALTTAFAADLLDRFLAAKAAGRDKVVFIIPVGRLANTICWPPAATRPAKACATLSSSIWMNT